jgi:hypothetical protein
LWRGDEALRGEGIRSGGSPRGALLKSLLCFGDDAHLLLLSPDEEGVCSHADLREDP